MSLPEEGTVTFFKDRQSHTDSIGGLFNFSFTKSYSDKFDKSGGTLSGENLYIGGGHGRFGGSSAELALQAWNTKLDPSNLRGILIRNSSRTSHVADSLIYRDRIDNVDKDYRLYGEHNKPSGSYTGNGDAAYREILTSGIGGFAVIYSSDNNETILATPVGAFYASLSETDVKYIPTINFKPSYGAIGISHATYGNRNGVEYKYKVL